jgi:hypothetical protein
MSIRAQKRAKNRTAGRIVSHRPTKSRAGCVERKNVALLGYDSGGKEPESILFLANEVGSI